MSTRRAVWLPHSQTPLFVCSLLFPASPNSNDYCGPFFYSRLLFSGPFFPSVFINMLFFGKFFKAHKSETHASCIERITTEGRYGWATVATSNDPMDNSFCLNRSFCPWVWVLSLVIQRSHLLVHRCLFHLQYLQILSCLWYTCNFAYDVLYLYCPTSIIASTVYYGYVIVLVMFALSNSSIENACRRGRIV